MKRLSDRLLHTSSEPSSDGELQTLETTRAPGIATARGHSRPSKILCRVMRTSSDPTSPVSEPIEVHGDGIKHDISASDAGALRAHDDNAARSASSRIACNASAVRVIDDDTTATCGASDTTTDAVRIDAHTMARPMSASRMGL